MTLLRGTDRIGEYGAGEKPAAFSQTLRRARKRWSCVECGDSTEPGEQYVELSGVWRENGPKRFRQCKACNDWAQAARLGVGLVHYPIGSLREAIEEATRVGLGEYAVDRKRV